MLPSLLLSLALNQVVTVPPATTVPIGESAPQRLEFGTLSAPLAMPLTQTVRDWALANGARYGLAPTSTLELTAAFSTRFGGSFHLQQVARGLEVYDGKLVVTLDLAGQVTQVASSLVASNAIVLGLLGRDEALKRAALAVPFAALQSTGVPYGGAKAMLFAVGSELHGGFLANVRTPDVRANWYVAIDGTNGAVLFAQNRVHHGALDAQVYPRSPGGLDAGVGATPTVLRTLEHADGGSMLGDECAVPLDDGGMASAPNDAGQLCGTQLTAYNCCVTENCQLDAGIHHYVGQLMYQGLPIAIDLAVCSRTRRASNQTNGSHDFVYGPVDPPHDTVNVVASDEANSDTFAEVHAFYHVNRVYDWVRGLSGTASGVFNSPGIEPFKMRDERRVPAQKPAVWANVTFPNLNELLSNPGCVLVPPCTASTLMRIDNAAFLPRENFAQLPIPGLDTGVDTLMILQGNSADAAYDSTVIQHEFGHGVVYATANLSFGAAAVDARSANSETGALHEGFADYIAAAFNGDPEIGPYFGPRVLAAASLGGLRADRYLRTMTNTLTCPGVLWGEVHQDSQHVAAALWQARTEFAGADHGNTFDAAFYAMLVSLTPTADFAMVASVMAAKVGVAFPSQSGASARLTQIMKDKGVIDCSKVLDITSASATRPYYGIATTSDYGQALIPGPIQFKFDAPQGVAKVKVTGTPPQMSRQSIQALVKVGSPIAFTWNDKGTSTNDSTSTFAVASSGTGSGALDAGCGSTVYVSLAQAGGGAVLQNLKVEIEPRAMCDVVDAGQPPLSLPAAGTLTQPQAKTCGCSSFEGLALLGLVGWGLAARRRRVH